MNNEFKDQAIKQAMVFAGVTEDQARYIFEATLDGVHKVLTGKSKKFEDEPQRRAARLCAGIVSDLRHEDYRISTSELQSQERRWSTDEN